jgi:hypothetical protein
MSPNMSPKKASFFGIGELEWRLGLSPKGVKDPSLFGWNGISEISFENIGVELKC